MSDQQAALTVSDPHEGVRLLSLNRPKQYNALNTPLLSLIAEALASAENDDAVKVVVITGGERIFAAGADVAEMATKDRQGMEDSPRPNLWGQIARFEKPLIAAVNGLALGAGCELAMHADIVIAAETAKFGLPEVGLGIMPGAGGTQRLLRIVGKSLAMKMVLSCEAITAQEALSAGLVAQVCIAEMVQENALKLACTIAAKPPLAVRLAKQSLLKAYETSLQDGLEFEQQAFVSLADTDDRNEGLAAFLEKRKPVYKGR
jgi:enoyl-CoA hydratase